MDALIDWCAGRAAKVVVSNRSRRLVEATLRSARLDSRLDAVITVEDAARPKPFPDLYLRAVAAVGADPQDCVAFEDSPTGVLAAQAAGVRVIGVPSHLDADIGADWHVPSLDHPVARGSGDALVQFPISLSSLAASMSDWSCRSAPATAGRGGAVRTPALGCPP